MISLGTWSRTAALNTFVCVCVYVCVCVCVCVYTMSGEIKDGKR